MNILIPNSWLKDYIKTNASADQIADALSLHSFSVEKIDRVEGDEIFEIEVTPNRGDALSVQGIARELNAVLPSLGYECSWVKEEFKDNAKHTDDDSLSLEIKDNTLVPRFSALVLSNVEIKESPEYIKERLEKVGIRSINNVVDVTNYLMIELGHPMHAFDYDKISGHKMIVRESLENEHVTTLDGVDRSLPSGVIIIEDGDGKIIDLCGIMGGLNSEVDKSTKKVLLFVQVYDPVRIRKASMSLGHRTEAALRFEKGVDFGSVVSSLNEAAGLLCSISGSHISSDLIDVVIEGVDSKYIEIDYSRIKLLAGIDIEDEFIDTTLKNLGFEIKGGKAKVPSWRYDDIDIPEDLAEEVIRIYGYYKLPNRLPDGQVPQRFVEKNFYWEDRIRDLLKHLGFFECYTYTASHKDIVGEDLLKLSNPLTEDFYYFRSSLIPQLLEVLKRNKGYSDRIKLFELASVYHSVEGDLPHQPFNLALVTKGVDYLDLKGIVEVILDDMGISSYSFDIKNLEGTLCVELNFDDLVSKSDSSYTYIPLTTSVSIKEDLTMDVSGEVSYQDIVSRLLSVDSKIVKISFKDLYKNSLTLSFEYLDRDRQLTSEDATEIRGRIISEIKSMGMSVKGF